MYPQLDLEDNGHLKNKTEDLGALRKMGTSQNILCPTIKFTLLYGWVVNVRIAFITNQSEIMKLIDHLNILRFSPAPAMRSPPIPIELFS